MISVQSELGRLIAFGGLLALIAKALSRKDEKPNTPNAPNTSHAPNAPGSPIPQSPGSSRIWPIDDRDIIELGQSVMSDRDGKGRPHKGIDIYAPSGTSIRASVAGRVLRVVDGRSSNDEKRRAAGLWVDVLGTDKLVYRYLHLGSSNVTQGQNITQGHNIGTIAAAHTSGLGNRPHLHFEIRETDYLQLNRDYGRPIDPTTSLPSRR